MIFIFGLGNPGDKYQQTRHNIGFASVDFWAEELGTNWQDSKKMKAQLARQGELLLVKPQTFMNESGQAARAVIDFYQPELLKNSSNKSQDQDLKNVVVIHDDLDLELGSYKIQWATGPKVHNGLNSIYQHLGTTQFWHVRMGVDNRQGDRSIPGSSYVLKKLTADEQVQVKQSIEQAISEILTRF